ncbi:MAG: hypothetical protein ACETWD_09985 [Desulfatiglandales bacterium]
MKETRETSFRLSSSTRNYYAIFKLKEKVNMDLRTSGEMTLEKVCMIGSQTLQPHIFQAMLPGKKTKRCLFAIELFLMKNIHPANGFSTNHLAEISLNRLQVSMAKQHLRYDFKGHAIATGALSTQRVKIFKTIQVH